MSDSATELCKDLGTAKSMIKLLEHRIESLTDENNGIREYSNGQTQTIQRLESEVEEIKEEYEKDSIEYEKQIADLEARNIHQLCIIRDQKARIAELEKQQKCPPHDFKSKGDGTAYCTDCGELCDVTETGAAR